MSDDAHDKALRRIAAYRAKAPIDEWSEAAAFDAVQRIAREALDPEARASRIAEQDALRDGNLAAIRALTKNQFYFLDHGHGDGTWVKFIKGDANKAHEGIVVVEHYFAIGRFGITGRRRGERHSCNVCNLKVNGPGREQLRRLLDKAGLQ